MVLMRNLRLSQTLGTWGPHPLQQETRRPTVTRVRAAPCRTSQNRLNSHLDVTVYIFPLRPPLCPI